MKILLAGKNGQVGRELHHALPILGEVLAFDRSGLDLRNPQSIRATVRELRPDVIVNAAAYTAVDEAEGKADLAMAVNGIAPGILAEEASRLGALLIHYSTDYVFDGAKASAYSEDDSPNPLNVYGQTKLAGEMAIKEVGAAHLILRTSWVYGTHGPNFVLKILQLMRERDELRVVDDQIGAPTWSRSIAEATAKILRMLFAQDAPRQDSGTFHLTAAGIASWCEVAEEIAVRVNGPARRSLKIVPISSEDYVSIAKRPKNSVLANNKFHETFNFGLRPWQTDLTAVLAECESLAS